MSAVAALAPLAAERSWDDIPGAQLVGGAIGLVILLMAIRWMIKRPK